MCALVYDIENSYDEHVPTIVDNMESSYSELRKSKRQRKEVSFGDDFYTHLIESEPSSYFEAISSSYSTTRNSQFTDKNYR